MGDDPQALYVVELADTAGPRRSSEHPNLYVGLTLLDPSERFARHRRAGSRNSVVRKHGVRLRPDLYEDERIRHTVEDALEAERQVAARLTAKGYSVRGGT